MEAITVELKNECLAITFSTTGGTLRLANVRDSSGYEFLNPQSEPGGTRETPPARNGNLWRIRFRDPKGQPLIAQSADAVLISHRKGEFVWEVPMGDACAQIRMTVRLNKKDSLSYWSLSGNLPEGWIITSVDFPIIENIKPKTRMAAPFGWGLEYEMKPGDSYEGTYPSLVAAMQFLAFYNRGHGLYIGAHDPHANHKHFSAKASNEGIAFSLTNHLAFLEKPAREWKVPFDVAIGVFAGDYYDAAQIYREWTFNAPWGKAGAVSKRPIPEWLKETDLWIRVKDVWSDIESEPVENLEMAKQAADFFGIPIAFHWYTWHEIPFDTLYPEYFPAKPHFAEGVRALQESGFHVMPYINGRLCDPNSRTWNEEQGYKWAARKENGEPYTEVYGSKVPLNVMCPYTTQWQQKIAGIVERLVNEYNVDGVYIDQISAAAAVECFDPKHGHPLGGGHFWADGYRRFLDLTRKRLPQGKILTTEENAECWLDQFDALLLVNTPVGVRRVIPLFPAVYSGRTIVFGFQYTLPEDLRDSAPWRAKMSQAFVFGSQLGWVSLSTLMDPSVRPEAEFLRRLVQCRRFGHEYLTFGRFLGILDVRGDNPALKISAIRPFDGPCSFTLPTVLASAWLGEDGSLGVAAVNQSDKERLVSVRLPLARAKIRASKGFNLVRFGPTGMESECRSTDETQSFVIPAASALIVKIRQSQGKN